MRMPPPRLPTALVAVAAALALLAAGCGDDGDAGPTRAQPAHAAALERARAVEAAVADWAASGTLDEARAAAEHARNLITGPRVRGAGDADGNGRVREVRIGLLPGEDGTPGLATALARGCPLQDVLGGSWADPTARWDELFVRIEEWTPSNNRFPELPSHAQRVVGWASLTLAATSLAEAREHSGHAAAHARLVTDAIREPDASPCPGG